VQCVGEVVNERTGEVRGFHRFVRDLPLRVIEGGVCDTCESPVQQHAGPVTSRIYAFPLREVAVAFVAVGRVRRTRAAPTRTGSRADAGAWRASRVGRTWRSGSTCWRP